MDNRDVQEEDEDEDGGDDGKKAWTKGEKVGEHRTGEFRWRKL